MRGSAQRACRGDHASVIAAAVLAALTVPDARGVATAIASIVPHGPAQLSGRCVHRSCGQ
ncbi:hypothetical protein BCEN4_370118 [Burkholderia cenocepacia]|nr:hypothetical protein BCEN4_370118 [Burkholderia cenocepacia]